MKIFKTFLFMFFVVFLAGNSYSQQESKMDWGPIITGTEIPSNKIDSRLNKVVSQQEIDLNNQMKIAKKQGDMLKVQQLNYQMEKVSSDIKIVTPVLLPGSELTLALGDKAPFYNTELVSNFQVTSSLNVKASAIATEMRQASAGTLWLVVAQGTTRDTLRIYNSTTNGVTWTFVASYNSPAGVAPTINYDELDIEIIENTTGDKFLHGVFGANNAGKQITGWFALKITGGITGGSGLFAFPGDAAANRYYGPRITSDNAAYAGAAYTMIINAQDSVVGGVHWYKEKFIYCTNPYSSSPTFTYRADAFLFTTSNNIANNLTVDIAYFDTGDSVVVLESSIPDTTRIYFYTAYETGIGPRNYPGYYKGASSDGRKSYARIASPGSTRNLVIVYRTLFSNTGSDYDIRSLKSTNGTAIGTMTAMTAPDYTTQWSQQPDIMAIRNSSSWRAAHTNITTPANNADSVYYDVMNFTAGTWTRKGVNNTTSSLPGSGVLGPKPSYRYVSGDSCLTIWAPSGPIGLWSAIGCTGTIFTGITTTNNGVPNSFSLSQNYPNPFNPVTNIKFSIPNAGLLKLVVFDVAGREVATLINENVAAGYYNADFDASSLSSGVYFYQITSGDFVDTKKMVLIK